MLQAALLAVVISTPPGAAHHRAVSPVQQCFGAMDGAVYDGDPADRRLMRANVGACSKGLTQIARIRPTVAQGPEKLFLIGRILDRAATLSYMGLNDARTALREVTTANLYFRVAAGLPTQSPNFHAAAVANVTLTGIQLQTLRSDALASARAARAAVPLIALRSATRARTVIETTRSEHRSP